ncbi:MAG: YcxB family protein [Oscillospiraceae bacterium]
MIGISNGLLPDLGGKEELVESQESVTVIEFSYDNTLEEIDGAMKAFQQKYKSRRNTLSVVAYAVLTVAVVVAIVLNPTSVFAYAALMFCGFGLVYSITDKKRSRRKTIDALKDMNPEDYHARFFEDRIEIETIIRPKVNEVHVKIDEEADEDIISPLKTTFIIGQDLLEFMENDESLMLVFNRQQIYCFPKRCLSVEQENAVREFLSGSLAGENSD